MSNNKNQSIDDLFRQLGERESTPPSAGWAQMEAMLDAQGGKKKRGIVWYWVAAAFLPLVLAAGWFLFPRQNEVASVRPIQSQKNVTREQPKPIVSEGNSNEMAAETGKKFSENLPKKIEPGFKAKAFNRTGVNPEEEPILVAQNANEPFNQEGTQDPGKLEFSNPSAPEELAHAENINSLPDPNIASIEFRPGKPQSDSDEIASIEWKKGMTSREKLKNAVQKIRSGDFETIPTVAQAKENLFALIAHSK